MHIFSSSLERLFFLFHFTTVLSISKWEFFSFSFSSSLSSDSCSLLLPEFSNLLLLRILRLPWFYDFVWLSLYYDYYYYYYYLSFSSSFSSLFSSMFSCCWWCFCTCNTYQHCNQLLHCYQRKILYVAIISFISHCNKCPNINTNKVPWFRTDLVVIFTI